MSEKEEKDVDDVEEVEGERWRESTVLPPVRRRQKKREELPTGWERHEVTWVRAESSVKY